jgi:hypothetical protein
MSLSMIKEDTIDENAGNFKDVSALRNSWTRRGYSWDTIPFPEKWVMSRISLKPGIPHEIAQRSRLP